MRCRDRVTRVLMRRVHGLMIGTGRGREMSKVEGGGRRFSMVGLRMEKGAMTREGP